jgi:hypothetical protein
MAFQWLDMRISEEQDRRKRETATLNRLPDALQEVHKALLTCIDSFQKAFGAEAADIHLQSSKIRVIAREEVEGRWQQAGRVEVVVVPALPGFQIDNGTGGEPLLIDVGLLPGEKIFYRDRVKDQYVNMEDLTKMILDRAFFPRLAGE